MSQVKYKPRFIPGGPLDGLELYAVPSEGYPFTVVHVREVISND